MYEKLLRYIVMLNQWRKQHLSRDNFLIIAAAIVGVLGGIAASVLKKLVHLFTNFLQNDLQWQYKYYLFFFFPFIGILLTILYIKTFIRRRPFRHGIPPLIKSVSEGNSRLDFHNIYSQVISSALTVGLGGSAGLEAPAASSGAAIGSNLGRIFGLDYRETTLLLACGAAAGIAAAFGSPIAGMVFALEVLLPSFSVPAFIPLLISSALASVISRLMHSEPLFVYISGGWKIEAFWYYILFGIVAGFYTVYYSWLNDSIPKTFAKIKKTYNKVWVGGLILGAIVAVFPAAYGEGYIAIQKLLDGDYSSLLGNSFFKEYQGYTWLLIVFAVLSLLAKTYGCVITMSSGGNGGMFGPSVVIGGLLGFIFAFGLNQTGWVHLNVTHFMIAGMAASVSGAMHAPLTGIFLSAEITGGYALLVPLMAVAAIAFFINKSFRKYSIYTQGLAEQGSWVAEENRDDSILTHLKLKYLIDNDFVVLRPEDSAISRRKDIIHSDRNIFPVVSHEGILLGTMSIEKLLEHITSSATDVQQVPLSLLVQPVADKAVLGTPMKEVMQQMDQKNIRILPVVDTDNRYQGFVTRNSIFNRYRKLLRRKGEFL